MSDKVPKTREELALGVLNPKTNKRRSGYIEMYRSMRQWQEWLTSGEKGEDDLIEAAFAQADKMIAKRDAGTSDPGRLADDVEDQEFRDAQEARYRAEYDWNSSNDEAQLQQLLTLEVQSRATNRQFAAASLNVKDRVALLGELRNIAKDHAALQKSLGIDRPTRDTRRRTEDPMAALRSQIEAGATKMSELITEAPEYAAQAKTLEELRALMKHSGGLPYAWIDTWLDAHKRILGVQ